MSKTTNKFLEGSKTVPGLQQNPKEVIRRMASGTYEDRIARYFDNGNDPIPNYGRMTKTERLTAVRAKLDEIKAKKADHEAKLQMMALKRNQKNSNKDGTDKKTTATTEADTSGTNG